MSLAAHVLPSVCKDFIQALEACHQSGWMARLTGQCNAQKDALNGCLREEVRTASLLRQ